MQHWSWRKIYQGITGFDCYIAGFLGTQERLGLAGPAAAPGRPFRLLSPVHSPGYKHVQETGETAQETSLIINSKPPGPGGFNLCGSKHLKITGTGKVIDIFKVHNPTKLYLSYKHAANSMLTVFKIKYFGRSDLYAKHTQ